MDDELKLVGGVSAGSGAPIYQFFDYDEFHIKLAHSDDPNRYLLIDKQSLKSIASVFTDLAHKFTK